MVSCAGTAESGVGQTLPLQARIVPRLLGPQCLGLVQLHRHALSLCRFADHALATHPPQCVFVQVKGLVYWMDHVMWIQGGVAA